MFLVDLHCGIDAPVSLAWAASGTTLARRVLMRLGFHCASSIAVCWVYLLAPTTAVKWECSAIGCEKCSTKPDFRVLPTWIEHFCLSSESILFRRVVNAILSSYGFSINHEEVIIFHRPPPEACSYDRRVLALHLMTLDVMSSLELYCSASTFTAPTCNNYSEKYEFKPLHGQSLCFQYDCLGSKFSTL